jgi:hypothetical protein
MTATMGLGEVVWARIAEEVYLFGFPIVLMETTRRLAIGVALDVRRGASWARSDHGLSLLRTSRSVAPTIRSRRSFADVRASGHTDQLVDVDRFLHALEPVRPAG